MTYNSNNIPKLPLVEKDPWLEPVQKEVYERYSRYCSILQEIEENFGGLLSFADVYKNFGITYSSEHEGWFYREWAPAAENLYLIGDFNNWQPSHPLQYKENGIWEIFLDDKTYNNSFKHQGKVKVLVRSSKGWQERIPAYIRRVIQNDTTKNFDGQIWWPEKTFDWQGDNFNIRQLPELYIYECHVGMAQEKEGIGTYLEFIENIIPRVKKAGYNTIQLMAVAEHPYYGSFGYHVANFFAPSSRFGTPEDLKLLIRTAHQHGLAVVMDIVHSHTVKNVNEGINQFDGTVEQYFHPDERGEHPSWDSKLFNYGKREVLQFLLSNIKYWMEEFHFDGFRFDGVTSMMYFHHGYTTFDSQDKFFKEGVEWDAITYLQLANALIHSINPNAISIAEDVSGMPGLTNTPEEGGIGFDYRLGMGIPDYWIKLLKEQADEDWNIYELWHVMTNRLPDVKTIAYCESHDQALVGDKTIAFRLMDKEMYYHMQVSDGNLLIDRGLALHKLIRMFTLSLGGEAYLNFMGNEFGHPEWIDFPREGNNWSYKYARRQWSLTEDTKLKYKFLLAFDKAMLRIISENRILSTGYGRQINMDDNNKSIIFEKSGLIFIFNFHPSNSVPGYKFPVNESGKYKLILNSDSTEFGGHSRIDESIEYFSQTEYNTVMLSVYSPCRTVLVLKKED